MTTINSNVNNLANSYKLITYVDLINIGLTTASLVNTTADVATVVNAMADKSMFVFSFANGQFGLPSVAYGVIEIIRHNNNRIILRATNRHNHVFYYGTYHSTAGFSGWYYITGTLLS